MSIEIIGVSLVVISALTSLATEGVKKLLDGVGKTYSSNLIAGGVSIILSAAYGVGYTIITGTAVSASLIVYLVGMVFLSWLCAMVGYDKVKQAIKQIIEE